MVLLVQFNFSKVPPLAEFPDCGLLLFFVATDDRFGNVSRCLLMWSSSAS